MMKHGTLLKDIEGLKDRLDKTNITYTYGAKNQPCGEVLERRCGDQG